MSAELGIELTLSGASEDADLWRRLALLAEERGIDLVVLTASAARDGLATGLDPWTVATWLVAATKRIAIGIPIDNIDAPDPSDPEAPYPGVIAKALESLEVLAPGRIISDSAKWIIASREAGSHEWSLLARGRIPVVVPVATLEDVERVAALASDGQLGSHPKRSVAARSRRIAGIDYDGIPGSLADTAIEPGDPKYRAVSSTYLRGGKPGLVLRPRRPEQVSEAVAFARRHTHLPLSIRSAGHGISGRSTNTGGLVIDVSAINGIEVLDRERKRVRIGPGATWKQIAVALDPYGWALGSGDYGGVGVGGLATAGGVGLLSRKYGLTIDHLVAVEMVLADGSFRRISKDSDPDLFWAVRGAGANFGIATAFEFEVYDVGDVGWAQLTLAVPDIETTLNAFGRLASNAPRDTTVFFVTGQPREGRSVVQLYALVDEPDPDTIVQRLTPFAQLGQLAQQQVVVTRYKDVMGMAHDIGPEGQHGFGEPVSRAALLPALTPEFAKDAAEMLASGQVYFFQLRTMGGAISDVSPEETAFSHRASAFQATAMGANDKRLNVLWDGMRHHFDGLYLSFETDRRPERLRDAFPLPVLEKLQQLKRRYDPDNLFKDNFNIDPNFDLSTLAEVRSSDQETAA